MPPKSKRTTTKGSHGANLGLEAKLSATADPPRNNIHQAEHKHVVLGLLFLRYTSDVFDANHADLDAQRTQSRRVTLLPTPLSGPLRLGTL